MKLGYVAGALIAVASVVGLVRVLSGTTGAQTEARRLDATLVSEYVRLVAEERYREAYETCLTRDYRGNLAAEDFVAAHAKRRQSLGAVLGRELTTLHESRNLFSGTHEVQLKYVLQYASGSRAGVVVVNDADGRMLVDGTYVEAGTVDTLSFEIW